MSPPDKIGVVSQKGGVGKSTLCRLLAVTYAQGGWDVKIADINIKQKTSTNWVADRLAGALEPVVAAEPFGTIKQALRHADAYDLVIFDGAPDSHETTRDIARESAALIIPTSTSKDDVNPQVLLAHELVEKHGVDPAKILFVINQALDSDAAVKGARGYIERAGYRVAAAHLAKKQGYELAQNTGRSIVETNYPTLNEAADRLAQEIVDFVSIHTAETV